MGHRSKVQYVRESIETIEQFDFGYDLYRSNLESEITHEAIHFGWLFTIAPAILEIGGEVDVFYRNYRSRWGYRESL